MIQSAFLDDNYSMGSFFYWFALLQYDHLMKGMTVGIKTLGVGTDHGIRNLTIGDAHR